MPEIFPTKGSNETVNGLHKMVNQLIDDEADFLALSFYDNKVKAQYQINGTNYELAVENIIKDINSDEVITNFITSLLEDQLNYWLHDGEVLGTDYRWKRKTKREKYNDNVRLELKESDPINYLEMDKIKSINDTLFLIRPGK